MPNKRVDAAAVYTNNLPSGAFRGYGLGQVIFAVESAMDELAGELGIDPFEFRRLNVDRAPTTRSSSRTSRATTCASASYGLDQCLDLAEAALARGNGVAAPTGRLAGRARAWRMAMIATIPPRGHDAEAHLAVDADGAYTLRVGTAEFGNGTTTVHTQLVAERARRPRPPGSRCCSATPT